MRRLLIVLLLSLATLRPAMAVERTVQVEFSFDPYAVPDKTVVGYRLYADGVPQCEVPVGPKQDLACTIEVAKHSYSFTLSALYSDNTESQHSPPFPFSFNSLCINPKKPGLLRINGAMIRLIVNPQ